MTDHPNGAAQAPVAPTPDPITELTSHVVVLFPQGTTMPVQIIPNLVDAVQILTAVRRLLAGPQEPGVPTPSIALVVDQPHLGNGQAGYVLLRFAQQGSPDVTVHVGNLSWGLVRAALEILEMDASYDLGVMVHQMKAQQAAAAPKLMLPTSVRMGD